MDYNSSSSSSSGHRWSLPYVSNTILIHCMYTFIHPHKVCGLSKMVERWTTLCEGTVRIERVSAIRYKNKFRRAGVESVWGTMAESER